MKTIQHCIFSQSESPQQDSSEYYRRNQSNRMWQRKIDRQLFNSEDIILQNVLADQISTTNPTDSHQINLTAIATTQPPPPPPPPPPPARPLLPPIELLLKKRGRKRRNLPKRNDGQKNFTRDILKKVARDIQTDPNAQRVIQSKLLLLGINYSEFQALLKEILRRNYVSNSVLLKRYLAPIQDDRQQRQLKQIFSQYFKYYLNNNLAIAIEESAQIQDLLAQIDYSRRYLAYLDLVEDGIVPNLRQNINQPNWI